MKSLRLVNCLVGMLVAGAAQAAEEYIGLFFQGTKIGYTVTTTVAETSGAEPLSRSETVTLMDMALLGAPLKVKIASFTWTDAKGRPKLMKFQMESAGRTQLVEANFAGTTIHVSVDNSGTRSTKTLAIPKDGRIVDDAVNALLEEGVPLGSSRSYYVLDPMTVSLVKNTATRHGREKVTVKGVEVGANVVEVVEPRATMRVFFSEKGDFLKALGPMGIEMIPLPKEEALAQVEASGPKPDLAELSRIVPNKPLGDTSALSSAKYRLFGANLTNAPSDGHQSVRRDNAAWIVDVHPDKASPTATIAAASKAAPAWVRPGLNIPSGSPEFRKLARQIVGASTKVDPAARAIQRYVSSNMRGNAGIGVLRDATEVLKSKEGVCRDYAILTATLLRAANIPARLASGLVYHEGAFYYHAWVEAFDGKSWFGVDSTRSDGRVGAGHVKLAHGTVEQAFMFTFLDKAKLEVIGTTTKKPGGGA